MSSEVEAGMSEVVADALPEDHLDSLEGQLRYFLNRIKDFPERSMVELIDANIRERLQNIRAAALRTQASEGDVGRDALLWVLYHHQGANSPVGQPLRVALGMGQHDRMTQGQVSDAMRFAARRNAATSDFHRYDPIPPTQQEARAVVAEYLAARDAYDEAARPSSQWAVQKQLRHDSPIAARLRDANAAMRALAPVSRP